MTTIDQALAGLRQGRLVAFPTETVYGLGADGEQPDAVAQIFAVKGRPPTRPITLHIHPETPCSRWADWDERAQALAAAFWPGPLTIIRPRTTHVPDIVAANGPSVGLRAPAHPLALELMARFGGAIAAPSANKTGRPSPTTAAHVRSEMGDQVPLILDGGPCTVGLESTVLSLVNTPTVLRQGQISAQQIAAVIGELPHQAQRDTAPHYRPSVPVVLWTEGTPLPTGNTGVLGPTAPEHAAAFVCGSTDPSAYATALYSAVRQLEASGVDCIAIARPPHTAAWRLVNDRLASMASSST